MKLPRMVLLSGPYKFIFLDSAGTVYMGLCARAFEDMSRTFVFGVLEVDMVGRPLAEPQRAAGSTPTLPGIAHPSWLFLAPLRPNPPRSAWLPGPAVPMEVLGSTSWVKRTPPEVFENYRPRDEQEFPLHSQAAM